MKNIRVFLFIVFVFCVSLLTLVIYKPVKDAGVIDAVCNDYFDKECTEFEELAKGPGYE